MKLKIDDTTVTLTGVTQEAIDVINGLGGVDGIIKTSIKTPPFEFLSMLPDHFMMTMSE